MIHDFTLYYAIGQVIDHYAYGDIVQGTIVEISKNKMTTTHEEVIWHNFVFKSTTFQWNPTQEASGYSPIVPLIITSS